MEEQLFQAKQMTLYEFNKLDITSQRRAVNEFGTFLESYRDDKERCSLYAIDMFFVEMIYHPINKSMKEIRAFKHGHRLDRYVNLSI